MLTLPKVLTPSVIHDLRNPVGTIIGFAGLLADSHLDARQRADLQDVQDAAQDLLTIINSLRQEPSEP